MYMLASNNRTNPGAFAVEDEMGRKTIYLFEQEDDAQRYLGLLEADDYPSMKLVEIEEELAIKSCERYNYFYQVITPDDILIPPRQNAIY